MPLDTQDTSQNQPRQFAVVVAVGPGLVDLFRLATLLQSLFRWESCVGWCVIVDDAGRPDRFAGLLPTSRNCRLVVLANPRNGRGNGLRGGLCAGLLTAYAWIQAKTAADFVLKIDTDALVIGPFSEPIRACLTEWPDAGLLGVLGDSCNPIVRARRSLEHREPCLVKVHRLLADVETPALVTEEESQRRGLPPFSVEKLRAFGLIRSHVVDAIRNGYGWDEFCQGGAYVLSRPMLDRMASAHYFERAEAWVALRTYEDRLMGMYARAVRLTVRDCSDQIFGVQFAGLPYPPAELRARDYRIVHSIKNDRTYPEHEIREFFRADIN